MKKSELRGTREVFLFTLSQTLKNKSYVIFMIIMLVLALASGPIMQLVMSPDTEVTEESGEGDGAEGEDTNEEQAKLETVYVYDELGFGAMGFFADKIIAAEREDLKVEVFKGTPEEYEALLKEIDEADAPKAVVHLYLSELSGMAIEIMQTEKYAEDAGKLVPLLSDSFEEWKLNISGVTEEQLAALDTPLSVGIDFVGEDGTVRDEKHSDGISDSQYWIIYGLLFVVTMVNTTSASQIATAIATDKSSKVVEYLLTSVRPMALIVGKVLAMLLSSIGQMILLLILAYGSSAVTGILTGEEGYLEQVLPAGIWESITLGNALLAIIVIVLGFIFYAVLAGMCGATVSRLEEVQEGLTFFTVVDMVGMYVGIIGAGMMMESATNPFVIVSILFPLSSCFLLPGGLLTGCITWPYALGGIAILVVADILLFRFVSRIYEVLITHNGSKIPMKDLFSMHKSMKKGGAKA